MDRSSPRGVHMGSGSLTVWGALPEKECPGRKAAESQHSKRSFL